MENINFKSYTVQDLVNKMKKLEQKYKQEKDKSSRSGTGKRKKVEVLWNYWQNIVWHFSFRGFSSFRQYVDQPMTTLPVSMQVTFYFQDVMQNDGKLFIRHFPGIKQMERRGAD